MTQLAEVSDKIISMGLFWAAMAALSVVVAAMAVASRTGVAMLIAILITVLGCAFTLSFLNDPVFGDGVVRENGWIWFADKFAASLLPVATVSVVWVWRSRRRAVAGFEIIASRKGGRR